MKNISTKKGFTLLELLVVIAIIGILASVVMVSVGTSRDKAKRSAFKAEISALVKPSVNYCLNNASGTFSYVAGSRIAAGTIACTAAGGITATTINPSPAITGCTSGTVADTGATFTSC